MAYNTSRRVDLGSLVGAPFAALQWRLLLLWVVLLLVPAAIVSLPLWGALGELLDHSVQAAAWAQSFNAMMFGDVMMQLGQNNAWLNGAGLAGLVVTLLLLPWLHGMVVAAGRAGRALGFGHLLQSGLIEYGRMFRLMLWSLLPYAVMLGLAGLAMGMASKQGDAAVLESKAVMARHVAMGVALALFVLAQAIVESARASFVADIGLRSATRALGRGVMQLLRRPLSTLLSYLLITLVGLAIALALGMARIHTPALGLGGFVLALLLTQLAVASNGWMHAARVFALARVAASLNPSRRGGGLPPAL
ncbi:hypothetical protein [Dyella sp.]|jgi:hypothetical protein|uniref:hypothetical protein n=1 Tax=Dyella sp. TaxID=1869338 RepID=UPI002D78EEA3|nr:hypothetical protein [Dyella sp.]HET6433733.1 hypothetical protein [Dyella sp.]